MVIPLKNSVHLKHDLLIIHISNNSSYRCVDSKKVIHRKILRNDKPPCINCYRL